MFKNLHIKPAILKLTGSRKEPRSIDEKMDDIIRLLSDKNIDAEKKKELQERFNLAIAGDAGENNYGSTDTAPGHNEDWIENEMEIILSRRQTKKVRLKKTSPVRHVSTFFRMLISILMIALGFAMIILPTPQSFEIYTIYYFNLNDGFTVMDLISLIIVFCGIYTLITTNRSRNKS